MTINYKKQKTAIMFLAMAVFTLSFLINISYSEINMTNSSDNSTNISLNITLDMDGDGYNSSLDCNDNNSSAYINLTGYADFDADNFTSGAGASFCTNGTLSISFSLIQNPEDCNDNNSSVNPNATEILYNNIDDDCNSQTRDYVLFNITPLKESYNIGETASFAIYAENHSNTNLTLKSPNNYYAYQAQYLNQTYPIYESLPYTKKVGEYIIMGSTTYSGYTIYQNKSIIVSNSITIELDGDKSIKPGEMFELEADASKGYGDYYNYTWYFEGYSPVKGRYANYTPAASGEYSLIVNAKDIEGNEKNQSFVLTIKKIYQLKIIALDKNTESAISGVYIEIGDTVLTTGSDGVALFNDVRGRYDVTAYKTGYKDYKYLNYYFSDNSTLMLRMSQIDQSSPVITLLNRSVHSIDGKASISFSVSDSSKSTCSIYTSTDSKWWSLKSTIPNITSSSEKVFLLDGLGNSSLRYRIECSDSDLNIALSEEGEITKQEALESLSISGSFGDILTIKEDFEAAKENLANLGAKENEAYSLLKFDLLLREAERLSSSFERDLDTIKNPRCPGINCNITDNEREKRINDLVLKTKNSIEATPVFLEVSSFEEFVKYPGKTDVENAIKRFYESKNKILTKNQLKQLVEKSFLLQSKLTVSTKVYHVNVQYISGKTEELTLIKNSFEIYDKENVIPNNKNFMLLQDIPKEASQNLKVTFASKATPLNNDNLFDIPLTDKSMAYYISSDIALEKIKLANTILISTAPPSSNSIIGFSILSPIEFKDINYVYVLVVIVFLILIFRLLMMFGLFESLKQKMFHSDEKEYHSMMMLINDAKDYLDAKDMQKSALIYKEIKLKYDGLSAKTRLRVYDNIIDLCSKIDEEYVKKLVEIAFDDLKKNNSGHAAKVYLVIEKAYRKLRDNSKQLFENEIRGIYSKLTR